MPVLHAQHTGELVERANALLGSLPEEQVEQCTYSFDDTLRLHWTNLPVGLAERPGIRYGDLSDNSRILLHRLLTNMLSSQGYLKATSIMNLDDILNVVIQAALDRGEITEEQYQNMRDFNWSYNSYYLSFWGKPGMVDPWGLKFEGHHISINLSVHGDEFAMTPLFLGTDPAEVPYTKYAGLRVLSKEEDYGFRLINSLTPEQKAKATLSQEVPKDIITNPKGPKRIDDYYGIRAGELGEVQQEYLKFLIREYVFNLEQPKADMEYRKILNAGIENIYFAWIGSYESHNPHYYIINGPTFMIEYDNAMSHGNHIHTIWREKGNDFGEDLLRQHYLEEKH